MIVLTSALASLPTPLNHLLGTGLADGLGARLSALPTFGLSLTLLALLLILGTGLGRLLGTHQWGIPEALLAGGLGLLVAPAGALPLIPPAVIRLWDQLPLVLLTLVFASLLLGKPLPAIGGLWRPLSAQMLLALTLAFGQYLVAALAVLLLLQPLLGAPAVMACLIEVAYEGGHGSAAAMGPTYARLGLESGEALGLALATVGLLASTLVGGLLVLLGRSRGWVRGGAAANAVESIDAASRTQAAAEMQPLRSQPVAALGANAGRAPARDPARSQDSLPRSMGSGNTPPQQAALTAPAPVAEAAGLVPPNDQPSSIGRTSPVQETAIAQGAIHHNSQPDRPQGVPTAIGPERRPADATSLEALRALSDAISAQPSQPPPFDTPNAAAPGTLGESAAAADSPPANDQPAALTPASVAVNLALTGAAVLIGVLMLEVLRRLAAWQGGLLAMVVDALPVFPLALLGSLLMRLVLERSGRTALVRPKLQARIGTLSADLLITAATACLDLSLLARDWLPLTVLATLGLVWNLAVILLLAPRILPASWFERSLVEFGQATGVAASGLLLLNMVDPEDRNGSLTPFSIKQLVLQPFLAGGVITVVAPLAVTGWGLPVWSGFCFALVILWIGLGLWLARSTRAVGG